MPRPKSKSELFALSQTNLEKLFKLIDTFSIEEQEQPFPPGTLNRNIRDVIGHLLHWQLLLLNWYEVGMKGENPDMPAKGFTWKETSGLNKLINERYKKESLASLRIRLQNSHLKLKTLLEQHSEVDLFEKKKYHWTGSTSLAAYLISATSSHYDWAYKLIRKVKK